MSDDKFRSLGPVRVREVDRVHKNPRCPVNPDKAGKPQGCTVASQQFCVQHQGQGAKKQ